MDANAFSDWLAPLSVPQRIRALALIYSDLTIGSRQFFLPNALRGKERVGIDMLHGMNEIHHTLANWLVAYSTDEREAFPVNTLGQQLFEIASQYRIGGFLTKAIEFAQTCKPSFNT